MNFILLVTNFILVLLIAIKNGESAKILFATGMPAASHQKPFQEVWKELSLRGHEVHVITPIPLKNQSLVNLTEYDVGDVLSYARSIVILNPEQQKQMFQRPGFFTAFLKDPFACYLWTKIHEYVLEHKNTRDLLKKDIQFDLVIVEWLFPTLSGLGAYYGCPMVGISSLGAPTAALDTLGNPSHPLIAPDMNLPLARDMTFKERLLSTLYSVYVRLYYHLKVLPDNDKIVKRALRSDLPYLGDIEKNVSLLLLNRNPVFHRPIPLLPNIIEIGGIRYPKDNKELDLELKKWLDNAEDGVVYFSLGSSFKTRLFDPESLKVFQDAFRLVPYKILWKWDDDSMENQPANVLIRKWLPQRAVLEHPNVKLFIYQGGLQSSEEVIAAHKPIIGIPTHSDQTSNVDTCVKYGMGRMIFSEELTSSRLAKEIMEIIKDERYAENARKLSDLMNDQSHNGLEKAIWWIEYVIRTNGAKHLRSVAVDLPFWQYFILDIIGSVLLAILGLFVVFIVMPYLVLRCLFRVTFGKNKIKLE